MTNKDLAYYMSLPYEVVVWRSDEDDSYFARIPDLPGVMTDAETWVGLEAMVEDAKAAWFTARLERGWDIPEPTRKTA